MLIIIRAGRSEIISQFAMLPLTACIASCASATHRRRVRICVWITVGYGRRTESLTVKSRETSIPKKKEKLEKTEEDDGNASESVWLL